MNRLSFADFHSKHFSQEQQEHWKSFLIQQNSYYYPNTTQQSTHPDKTHETNDHQQETYPQEKEDYSQEDTYSLSKEAIEIFEFSEAYRKEREEERLKTEEEEEEGKENWKFDESSVLYSGGVEAPATCLVLTKTNKVQSENLRMKEDLLNSAYISSCDNKDTDTPILFWPVIPLRL